MKNTITMKIMGVILTVAMLAGLILAAVPVSVSAANLSWSVVGQPKVTPNTTANMFAVAPDGKNMFVYSNPASVTGAALANGGGSVTAPGALALGINTFTWSANGTLTVTLPTGTYGIANSVTAAVTGSPVSLVPGTNTITIAGAAGNTFTVEVGGYLSKSTDGGLTWTNTSLGTSLNGAYVIDLAVSPNFGSDSLVVAVSPTAIYRSINGGNSWGLFGNPSAFTAGAAYTSLDVASDQSILVGWKNAGTGGVAVYNTNNLNWTQSSAVASGWTAADVYAVKFSPNYANDSVYMALANITATSVTLRTRVGTNIWNAGTDVGVATFVVGTTAITAVTQASIAVPSDYDWASSSNKVFVGLGGTTPANGTGVYRVTGKINGSASALTALENTINVSCLAFKGTASSGTLAVAAYDSRQVATSTNAISSNSPDFTTTEVLNSPSSESGSPNVQIQFSPTANTLYAGTKGVHSSLSLSNDYLSFQGFAFIGVSALANCQLSKLKGAGTPNMWVRFIDTNGGAGNTYAYFYSSDLGVNWKMILWNNTTVIDSIYITGTYTTDKTIYALQLTNRLLKSSDGGMTWTTISTPGNVNADMIALIDANTYWVSSQTGGNAGVTYGMRRSDSTATAAIDGKKTFAIAILPFGIVDFTWDGTAYVSTDSGANFTKLGTDGQFSQGNPPPPNFTFDVPNKAIYAQDTAGNLLKWVVGTDSAWSTSVNFSDLPTNLKSGAKSSLNLVGGVWYINSNNNTNGEVWQSVDLTDTTNAGFIPVADSGLPPGTATIGCGINGANGAGPQAAFKDASGNTVLYNLINRSTTLPTGEYAWTLEAFSNTLVAPPATVSPAANDNASVPVDFTWKPVTGTNIKYDVQVAYDNTFNNNAIPSTVTAAAYTATSSTIFAQVPLVAGKQYYWRVRVTNPMVGAWSPGVAFTTKAMSVATTGLDVQGRISPVNGESNVPLTPAITWGVVSGATYNFKIATDAGFTQVVDSKTGLTSTAYSPSAPLKNNTSYFWEVQAVIGTNTGDWVISSFTTTSGAAAAAAAAPAPAAPQTIVIPTPVFTVPPASVTVNTAPPATPGYIWVIIVIGAILVIAVIVLIARTRRV